MSCLWNDIVGVAVVSSCLSVGTLLVVKGKNGSWACGGTSGVTPTSDTIVVPSGSLILAITSDSSTRLVDLLMLFL